MIYLILCEQTETCKIGFSNNPEKRIKELQTSNPYQLSLISVIEGDINLEKQLHSRFRKFKIKGEWFSSNKLIIDYFSEHPTNSIKAFHYENPINVSSFGLNYICENFNHTESGKIVTIANYISGVLNIVCDKNLKSYDLKSLIELTKYSHNKHYDFINKLITYNVIHVLIERKNNIKLSANKELYNNHILFNPFIAKRSKVIHKDCLRYFQKLK